MSNEVCTAKTLLLNIFVIVIPKQGLAGRQITNLYSVLYQKKDWRGPTSFGITTTNILKKKNIFSGHTFNVLSLQLPYVFTGYFLQVYTDT